MFVAYTSPTAALITTSNAVYATNILPTSYAATQTLTTFTTPAIKAAVVTAGTGGATGTGSILVTYTENVVCPSTASSVQADFAYSNAGTPAYPSTCVNTDATHLTLGD